MAELLNIPESAAYLGMNHWTFRSARRRGDGPIPNARKDGKDLFTRSALKKWARARKANKKPRNGR